MQHKNRYGIQEKREFYSLFNLSVLPSGVLPDM
jgi:hypothetical protein